MSFCSQSSQFTFCKYQHMPWSFYWIRDCQQTPMSSFFFIHVTSIRLSFMSIYFGNFAHQKVSESFCNIYMHAAQLTMIVSSSVGRVFTSAHTKSQPLYIIRNQGDSFLAQKKDNTHSQSLLEFWLQVCLYNAFFCCQIPGKRSPHERKILSRVYG